MRTCVALLFVSVMVVLATAEGNKNEKNVEEWTSRVGRGTPNRNKVNLKRDRKRIKPTRQRNGPGRRSKKINHKISKPGVRVEISNRGNLQRTKNFENVKATLKQKNPPFPACSYLDFGKITAEGKDCSKDGYKFVVKGPTGVRKQFLHVDDRVILAFVATGEKFATCTKFEDITGQVECKIVGGLAGTILNTKKDLKKADNFDACSYLDLGQITVQGTDCSNDGYKFVVKGKPKGVRKQFLHVDNKVIVAFVAPGDDNKFANCPAFQDITAQVTCTKVDGLAGTKLDNVVSGSEFGLIVGGFRFSTTTETQVSTFGSCSPSISNPPYKIDGHAAAVLDGIVYYCGGYNKETKAYSSDCFKSASVGKYDWKPTDSMNYAKEGFTMNTLGSRLVAVGGYTKIPTEGVVASIEIYNPGSPWQDTWKLNTARYDHCTVTLSQSEIAVIGGWGGQKLSSVERINIDTGAKSSLNNIPVPMDALQCEILSNVIYVVGGRFGENDASTSAMYTLDLSSTGTNWKTSPYSLRLGRFYHQTAILNGKLVAYAGISVAFGIEYFVGSYETLTETGWILSTQCSDCSIKWFSLTVVPC